MEKHFDKIEYQYVQSEHLVELTMTVNVNESSGDSEE